MSDTRGMGRKLAALRKAKALSQPGLAGATGVGVMTIWRGEQTGRISRTTAEKLAPVLGVKPGDLLAAK